MALIGSPVTKLYYHVNLLEKDGRIGSHTGRGASGADGVGGGEWDRVEIVYIAE